MPISKYVEAKDVKGNQTLVLLSVHLIKSNRSEKGKLPTNLDPSFLMKNIDFTPNLLLRLADFVKFKYSPTMTKPIRTLKSKVFTGQVNLPHLLFTSISRPFHSLQLSWKLLFLWVSFLNWKMARSGRMSMYIIFPGFEILLDPVKSLCNQTVGFPSFEKTTSLPRLARFYAINVIAQILLGH